MKTRRFIGIWRTLCLRDWSLVWRFYGLEAMLFTIKWEWIETNASNQMIFPPILKIHGTFIKGFEDIHREQKWKRRKSVSIIYLISHIFFIHWLLNFENFLQVWKMLEFPISIHSLWSWEVSLILKQIFLDFEFLFLLWTRWYEMTSIWKEILCIGGNKGPNQTYEIFMMKFVGTRCKTQIKYHKVNSSCKLVWHLCI